MAFTLLLGMALLHVSDKIRQVLDIEITISLSTLQQFWNHLYLLQFLETVLDLFLSLLANIFDSQSVEYAHFQQDLAKF